MNATDDMKFRKALSIVRSPMKIFVEGNIGSGKTMLVNYFKEHYGLLVETVSEPVDAWRNLHGENLLNLVYQNPSRYGITLQSYVQLTMLQSHLHVNQNKPITMIERSLLSASCNMPKADYLVLTTWFDWLVKQFSIQADLTIYLRTSPEEVHRRIKMRSRSEESCIPLSYLTQLHNLHEDWLIKKAFPGTLGNIMTVSEPVDAWRNLHGENLLNLVYQNPSRYGITLQSYVQLTMLQSHLHVNQNKPITMIERSLLSASCNMPKADYLVLTTWFDWLVKQFSIQADLTIYLRTSPEEVHRRIKMRSRSEESCIPLSYLTQLHNLHEDWLIKKAFPGTLGNIMILDANLPISSMEMEYEKLHSYIVDEHDEVENVAIDVKCANERL